MKIRPTLRPFALAGIGALLAASSLAQDSGYLYGGAGVGRARASFDEEGMAARALGAGQTASITARDESDTSYRVFLGYQMTRHFALETGYFKLGRFGFDAATLPAGTLGGELRVQGMDLDLVGTLPLSQNWSALGRIGASYARSRGTFNTSGLAVVADPTPSKRDVNAKFGLGLQYAFSPSFLVRGEVERYRANDTLGQHGNVNVVSMSLVFPFGRTATHTPRAMAAPAYVAQAPAPRPEPRPEPVVVAPPPPAPAPVMVVAAPPPPPAPEPVRQRVSFSAESLFGFDRSTVQPEGAAALDAFTQQIAGTRYDSISVEGHTDRLGTTEYNQSLSQQRAESVKSYLVTNGRLDATRISAVGKSESDPVTRAQDCVGNRQSAKLIACLQPDRRVEVEVTGTR